jgi:HK97 gp10 family phage protein
MRKQAPKKSKTLARSVAIGSSKYKGSFDIRVGPRIRGKGNNIGWYSHFVELGTKPKKDWLGNKKGVTGKGQDSNPFIEKAWNLKKAEVEKDMRARILNFIKFE